MTSIDTPPGWNPRLQELVVAHIKKYASLNEFYSSGKMSLKIDKERVEFILGQDDEEFHKAVWWKLENARIKNSRNGKFLDQEKTEAIQKNTAYISRVLKYDENNNPVKDIGAIITYKGVHYTIGLPGMEESFMAALYRVNKSHLKRWNNMDPEDQKAKIASRPASSRKKGYDMDVELYRQGEKAYLVAEHKKTGKILTNLPASRNSLRTKFRQLGKEAKILEKKKAAAEKKQAEGDQKPAASEDNPLKNLMF